MQQIADFLHGIYQQGKLKVRTIKGYKSAIVATLKARGMNIKADPYICGFITDSTWIDRQNLIWYRIGILQ